MAERYLTDGIAAGPCPILSIYRGSQNARGILSVGLERHPWQRIRIVQRKFLYPLVQPEPPVRGMLSRRHTSGNVFIGSS